MSNNNSNNSKRDQSSSSGTKGPPSSTKRRDGGGRRKRGDGDRGSSSGAADTLGSTNRDLEDLRDRLAKLYQVVQVVLQASEKALQESAGEPLDYILNNPDQIEPLYAGEKLLEEDQLREAVEAPQEELNQIAKRKVESLDWKNSVLLVKWVMGRGIARTLKSIQSMASALAKLEKKAAASKSHQHPAPPTKHETPQKKPSSNKKTPVHTSRNAFAWSSFQNSPDPKSLPIPNFVSTPVKAPSTPNKFGIPSPPQPPLTVRSAAKEAVKQQQQSKASEVDTQRPAAFKTPNGKQKRSELKSNKSAQAWNTEGAISNPITPSPIRGSVERTSSKTQSSTNASSVSSADALNTDATNALRQMLGLEAVQ